MDWINVKEKLPEPLVDVLVFFPGDRKIKIAWVYDNGVWAFERSMGAPTHWMPLPQLPKEAE